ncbi:hypothetical protein ACH4VR_29590 [Streptomyces sp. NPDC020883]|uniref:hypothetical protein n=1 Tax=Streptomyces sp. NPDC020883 TaxID=3365099 RepID=UPI0037966145
MAGHGYTWGALRDTQAAKLRVGDIFVQPGLGTAYRVRSDGKVYSAGIAWGMKLDGTAWTVTARDGNTITARSHTGRTVTDTIPPTTHVLRVTSQEHDEEPGPGKATADTVTADTDCPRHQSTGAGGATMFTTTEANHAHATHQSATGQWTNKDRTAARKFAGKWLAEQRFLQRTMDPTDDALSSAFATCARPPSPHLYPLIRETLAHWNAKKPRSHGQRLKRYTVTEIYQPGNEILWTARIGHEVAVSLQCPQTNGTWEISPLRRALARHAEVAEDQIRPVRARADTGIAPRLWEVDTPAQDEPEQLHL